jgi:hypothetical protein
VEYILKLNEASVHHIPIGLIRVTTVSEARLNNGDQDQ